MEIEPFWAVEETPDDLQKWSKVKQWCPKKQWYAFPNAIERPRFNMYSDRPSWKDSLPDRPLIVLAH